MQWAIFAGAIVTILWIPALLHFVRAWRSRHNPVSLAITAHILFTMLQSVPAALWVLDERTDRELVIALALALSAALCCLYLWAFRWSDQRFKNERTKP